jgi:hypothetical protein
VGNVEVGVWEMLRGECYLGLSREGVEGGVIVQVGKMGRVCVWCGLYMWVSWCVWVLC